MRVLITRPNGYRGNGVDARCGQVVDLPADAAAGLISAGWAVAAEVPAVVAAPAEQVESEAPVLTAARNGAAKKWKRKG